MAENKPVSIHIMGNEYHVASPEDEVEKLEHLQHEIITFLLYN